MYIFTAPSSQSQCGNPTWGGHYIFVMAMILFSYGLKLKRNETISCLNFKPELPWHKKSCCGARVLRTLTNHQAFYVW